MEKFFNRKVILKAAGIVFLVIVAGLVIADVKIYFKKRELMKQIEAYQNQIEEIKQSSQKLQEEIDNADDQDYLETLAYEQLNQQKPGEKQVIFVQAEEDVEEGISKQTFWGRFVGWIKSIFE